MEHFRQRCMELETASLLAQKQSPQRRHQGTAVPSGSDSPRALVPSKSLRAQAYSDAGVGHGSVGRTRDAASSPIRGACSRACELHLAPPSCVQMGDLVVCVVVLLIAGDRAVRHSPSPNALGSSSGGGECPRRRETPPCVHTAIDAVVHVCVQCDLLKASQHTVRSCKAR
jgi:hypothetical protein